MSLRLESWEDGSLERMRAMVGHPSLQPEFEPLLGHGLDGLMGDVHLCAPARRIATLDGVDSGFGYALVVTTAEGRFAALRLGVLGPARRRGVGSALLAEMTRIVLAEAPDLGELELGAALPNPAAEGFVARHGYRPRRAYWVMERAATPPPAPDWPEGVVVRGFDGSDAELARWVETFNLAWRDHDHPILATLDGFRHQLDHGAVDPAGMFLAERAGDALGFVRTSLHEGRGEISILGVIPRARGLGLGRALLRHGIGQLVGQRVPRVTLYVDGENERALRLYRQEAFAVIRTRQLWSRPPTGERSP